MSLFSVLASRVCLDLVFFPELDASGKVTSVFFTLSWAVSLFSKLLRAREESGIMCIVVLVGHTMSVPD